MTYFLNRYKNAISRRGWMLGLALAPLLIYLVASAICPAFYTIHQKVSLLDDGKVNKTSLKRMDDLVARSEAFFLSDPVIERLEKEVRNGKIDNRMDWMQTPSSQLELILSAAVERTMSLKRLDEEAALVAYHGEHRELGEKLVFFFD